MTAMIDRRRRRCRLAPKAAAALAAAVGLWALASPDSAHAGSRQITPWCAFMGGTYGYDCSYFTFEQCMETARGLGNHCIPNPRQGYVANRQRHRVRK